MLKAAAKHIPPVRILWKMYFCTIRRLMMFKDTIQNKDVLHVYTLNMQVRVVSLWKWVFIPMARGEYVLIEPAHVST